MKSEESAAAMVMLRKKRSQFLMGLFVLPLMAVAQTKQISATAREMAKQGFVDVTTLDSTIRVSLMYSRADNFTGKVMYADLKEAYLHPDAAKALVKAQRLLKQQHPELTLKIYDAARPMHIQQKMWDVVAGTSKSIYVSNPKNGGGLHNYGMAVDLTLAEAATGDTLDMGTMVDYLGSYAHITDEASLVQHHIITAQARKNRELLRKVMQEAGFKALKTEWWHFNFITRAEARAKYKAIK